MKKRKLVQWALAYLAGAWVVLEALDVLESPLGLSTALQQGVLIVLGIGLLATLVLAWFHGEKGRQRVGGVELLLLTGLFLLGGFALSFLEKDVGDGTDGGRESASGLSFSEEERSRRIAVLPFENHSPDPSETQHILEGIYDQIHSRLSQLPSLEVISPESSARVAELPGLDLPAIGDELSVALVLSATIRVIEDDLRLTARLTESRNDRTLDSYDFVRKLNPAGLFDMETELAIQVAQAIRAEVSPTLQQEWEILPTENEYAYDAYLRGKSFLNSFEPDSAEQSFLDAIDLDPRFAQAHAELAVTYVLLNNLNRRLPEEAFPLARLSAGRARELNERLVETQMALVTLAFSVDRDWFGVEALLEMILRKNPSNSRAHDWYAQYLSLVGRHEAALNQSRQAWRLNPGDAMARYKVGRTLYWARRCDEAVPHLWRTLQVHPDLDRSRLYLSHCFLEGGRYDEALALHREPEGLSVGERTSWRLSLAATLARAGNGAEAREILVEAEALRESEKVSAGYIAVVHAALGQANQAFDWLEKAREEYDSWLFQLQHPWWDPIRGDPRFSELLETLNLPYSVALEPPSWSFPADWDYQLSTGG